MGWGRMGWGGVGYRRCRVGKGRVDRVGLG